MLNDLDRDGGLFLLKASLVVGMRTLSLDYIFDGLDRCGFGFLLKAQKID